MNEEADKSAALDERAKAVKIELAKAKRATQAIVDRIAAIDKLLPYVHVDFARLTNEVRERQASVHTRTARLSLVSENLSENAVEHLLDQRFDAAVSLVEAQAEELQRRLTTNRASLQALEKSQNNLTVLTQRLRTTALDILQRGPNPDHCPVCHTEFESGQLFIRMMSDIDSSTSEQSALLQTEIAGADEALISVRSAQSALESLRVFLGESAQSATIREALAQIEQERASLERERTTLAAAQSLVHQLQIEGLSSEDLSGKLLGLGLTELPSPDELEVMQEQSKEALSTLQDASNDLLQESNEVQRECENLAVRLSINLPESTEALAKMISQQVSDIEAALGARQSLALILTIGSSTNAGEIAIKLSAAQQVVAKVATAIEQESANDAALDKETKAVADLDTKIGGCNTKIANLVDAEHVLESLTQQSSGGELTNQILAENAQEIARTFASIHMPNGNPPIYSDCQK